MRPPAQPQPQRQSWHLRRLLRAFRPGQGAPPWREVLRTALGCALAVMVAAGLIAASGLPVATGLILIAPFGGSAMLVIAVPNSPLAQPRALLLGNGGAALIGVAAALLVPVPALAAGVALGGAVAFMLVARAVHPPAGAVALMPVLAPDLVAEHGLRFALTPVASDALILILFAMAWHRMTGRVYPFRQPDEAPRAASRFSRDDLAAILDRMRLSQNIGVADFARLLAAADSIRSADDRTAGLTCADAAGPLPGVLAPDQTLAEARDLMLGARAYSLPVVAPDGVLLGVLTQSDLLRAPDDRAAVAGAMTPGPTVLAAGAPLHEATAVLARGRWRAVPLVDAAGRCIAMLTRADLIGVLAHAPAGPSAPSAPPPGGPHPRP